MAEVDRFDKAAYSLSGVNAGVWEGFIFVNLADAPLSVDEWFAPLSGKFSTWNMPLLRSAHSITYDVRANWKLIFENYSECYHCPGVHPALSKLSPYDSAENDLAEGPFLGGFMKINPGSSLSMSGNECAMPIGDRNSASRARDESLRPATPRQEEQQQDKENEPKDTRRVFYYSIFPNMLLSIHPEYVMVHQLRAEAPDRTTIHCDWYFHPDAFDRGDFRPEDAVEFWDVTNREDWHVCELSQQGIASRAYEPGPYSSRETIPAAWDAYYLTRMR